MRTIKFGVVGEYQSGKSLLINCLLQRSIATVGSGNATTHTVVNYLFGEDEYVEYISHDDATNTIDIKNIESLDADTSIKVINIYLNNPLLKLYSLTDMPGLGYNDEDNRAAVKAISDIDYAIVVASNYKSIGGSESSSYGNIRTLKQYRVPYYFILNCTLPDSEKWNPTDMYNENIAKVNRNIIEFYKPISFPFENEFVPIVNLMWYWFASQAPEDELLQRRENKININIHKLNNDNIKNSDIEKASNFNLIKQIFGMENKVYLELRRDFTEAIKQLREEVCPIGTIQAFAFEYAPEGWLICDGRTLSSETHPILYAAIGNTFGGNGANNFMIPDLRGRFMRGWSNDGIIDKGRKLGSAQDDAFQSHYHKFDAEKLSISDNGSHYHPLSCDEYDTVNSVSGLASADTAKRMCYPTKSLSGGTDLCASAGSHTHKLNVLEFPVCDPINSNNSIRTDSETRPANIALLFCIKYE